MTMLLQRKDLYDCMISVFVTEWRLKPGHKDDLTLTDFSLCYSIAIKTLTQRWPYFEYMSITENHQIKVSLGSEGEERLVSLLWSPTVSTHGVPDNFVDIIVSTVKSDIKVESYVTPSSWTLLYVHSESSKYKNSNAYKNILVVYSKCSTQFNWVNLTEIKGSWL